MCDKCQELDRMIERYRTLMHRVADRQTNEGIGKLIEDLRLKKPRSTPSAKLISAAPWRGGGPLLWCSQPGRGKPFADVGGGLGHPRSADKLLTLNPWWGTLGFFTQALRLFR